MKILDTERLTLRTIDADDAAFYYELVNDPTWLEHIGDEGIRSIEDARKAILEGPCAMQQQLGYSLYVMERKSDGKPLGLCGLIKRDALPDVDIGYAIRPAWFGQGYTYEAAAAVVALCARAAAHAATAGHHFAGQYQFDPAAAKTGLGLCRNQDFHAA